MPATESNHSEIAQNYPGVMMPIAGDAQGKNLLSMYQLNAADIGDYLREAYAAEQVVRSQHGVNMLPGTVLKCVMRQPSTRTGGSMSTAMMKLGGSAQLVSGMGSSSEAKGESLGDSWLAFAAQSDALGIRTAESKGPAFAAHTIAQAVERGQLWQPVPVINLGDGWNEHPTQALGDLFTIHRERQQLEGLTLTVVGDHERYRAHHSLIIGAVTMGMRVVAVESPVAPMPDSLVDFAGAALRRTTDLDAAMRETDVLYLGRNPDEYTGENQAEQARSRRLADDFRSWTVNHERLQCMSPEAMVLHPRPRRDELSPDVDADRRMHDVQQMVNMTPMRMAILARHLGGTLIARDAAA